MDQESAGFGRSRLAAGQTVLTGRVIGKKVFSCVIGPRLAALYCLRSETPKCQFMRLQFGCGRDAAQEA